MKKIYFYKKSSSAKVQKHHFGSYLIIFIHFCPNAIFPNKSGSVTHNPAGNPTTLLSFRKSKLIG